MITDQYWFELAIKGPSSDCLFVCIRTSASQLLTNWAADDDDEVSPFNSQMTNFQRIPQTILSLSISFFLSFFSFFVVSIICNKSLPGFTTSFSKFKIQKNKTKFKNTTYKFMYKLFPSSGIITIWGKK